MKNFKNFIAFKVSNTRITISNIILNFNFNHTKALEYLNEKYKNKSIKIEFPHYSLYVINVHSFKLNSNGHYMVEADNIFGKDEHIKYSNKYVFNIFNDRISIIDEVEIFNKKNLEIDPYNEENWDDDDVEIIKKRTPDGGWYDQENDE